MPNDPPVNHQANLGSYLKTLERRVWDLERRLLPPKAKAPPAGMFTDSWITATLTADVTDPTGPDLQWAVFGSAGSDLSLPTAGAFVVANDGWYQPYLAVAVYQSLDADGSLEVIMDNASGHSGMTDFLDCRIIMPIRPASGDGGRRSTATQTIPVAKYYAGDEITWGATAFLDAGTIDVVGNQTFCAITRVG